MSLPMPPQNETGAVNNSGSLEQILQLLGIDGMVELCRAFWEITADDNCRVKKRGSM